jgi:hypothetical protein
LEAASPNLDALAIEMIDVAHPFMGDRTGMFGYPTALMWSGPTDKLVAQREVGG